MVELSASQQTPKSYKSFIEYIQNLQKDVSSIVKLLLGTGVVSDTVANIAPTITAAYTLTGGKYTLSVTSSYAQPLAASYVLTNNSTGMLVESLLNAASSHFIPFDEDTHVLNGSTNNPIEVPYPHTTSTSAFANHVVESIGSAIYINGTPQPNANISIISKNASTNTAEIAFSQIIGGAIYPDPMTPDGALTDVVFQETMSTWFSIFGNPIQLTFSGLNIRRTNRPLILELYDINTNTFTYLKVFAAFQEDKPYYEITGPNSIQLHIPAATQAAFDPNSTQIRVYFATPVELNTTTSNNNKFFRQYKLPVNDLLPDPSSLKIFAISKTTGEVKELVSLSNSLTGSLYSLDYATGFLSVYNVSGTVPEDEFIAVAGYKYTPPVRPYNLSDYTNMVSIYYQIGAVYEQSGVVADTDLPNNLYLYLVPEENLRSIETFLNSGGKLQTTAQVRVFENGLITTTAPITTISIPEFESFPEFVVSPIELGTLTRTGYTYTFSPNPTANSPYDRLLALAATMPLITHTVFETEKTTETKEVAASEALIIPVDFIHTTATEVAFFGTTGKLRVSDAANPATTKQYNIELGYYNQVTNTFSVVQSLGTFDSGIDNGFINITQSTFPADSIWATTTPTTGQYLALQVTVANPSGESAFYYDYDLSTYINIKY